MRAKKLLLWTIFCCTLSFSSYSQTVIGRQNVDQFPCTPWGTIAYGLTWLPTDYNTNLTQRYPLLIFLHGVGETGNGVGGLWTLLNTGLPQTIANGWDPEAINPANGQNYKFIVVSPQAPTAAGWSFQWNNIQWILNDLLIRYRVDTSRVYITGLSAGGNGTWTCLTSGPAAAKKFAAAVTMASAPQAMDSISILGSQYGVKLWQICGDQDAFYNFSVNSTAAYNSGVPTPNPQAALTTFPGQGHWVSVWNTGYDPNWRSNVHNLNIYEWMLQYQRTFTTSTLTANAGADQTITLPVSQVTLNGTGTPPSGETISSYLWTKLTGPAGDIITTASAASTTVTNLSQGVYSFQLRVISSANDTAYATTQVTVNPAPPNTPPSVNAGSDIIIQLPVDSATLNGTATDSDGTISSQQWTWISGPAQYSIANPAQLQTIVNNLTTGVYLFEFSAMDDDNSVVKDTMQVTVLAAAAPVNVVPVANAGTDATIILPIDSVQLTGTGTDTDGSITSYLWKKIAGPASYIIADSSQAQTMVNGLVAGVYEFELSVIDDSSAVAKDTVLVTVSTAVVNVNPVANAGPDTTITLPVDSVLITGAATDVDGTIASYHWTKLSGPSSFSITSPDSAQTMMDSLTAGVYEFELEVTDNMGATGKDTMQIVVNAQPTTQCTGTKRYMIPDGAHGLYINGDTASWWHMEVNAGDTLVLKSQDAWSFFRMENYNGTSQCPIVVINEGGQVWLTAGFDATNCRHLKITGSGASNVFYGFRVYNPNDDGPGVAIGIGGRSSNVEVERIDVKNKGYGVWAKQDPTCDSSYNYPNFIMDSIHIHHCRFRVINQDCIYAGNTDPLGERITWCNGVETHPKPMRLSNINIHHLIIDSCGRTGIQLGGAETGFNQIHNNIVTNCGYEYNSVQGAGISIGGMTRNCHVYNNVIKNTFLFGIFDLGADSSFVYNNYIDSSGYLQIDPSIDVNALAAHLGLAASGQWLVNTPPGGISSIQSTTKPTIPFYPKTVFYKNNKVGVNTCPYPTGAISFSQWGPADDWTDKNKVCGNTKIDGITPASINQFWYIDSNKYWPRIDTSCNMSFLNVAPVAFAGNDTSITAPADSVLLHGIGTDTDGTIVSYYWEMISGPSQYTFTQPDSALNLAKDLVPGIYTFRLTVTDNGGASSTDDVQIKFDPPNHAPIANAGPFKIIVVPASTTTLDGYAMDPDDTILTYKWTKVAGPSSYTIGDSTQLQTTLINLVNGSYKFVLTVTDTSGAFDQDTMRVDVDIAPVTNAGPDLTTTMPVDWVNVYGTASDVDGSIATIKWTKISGPSQHTIIPVGQLHASFTNLVPGIYEFELMVADNFGIMARDTMKVTVIPAPVNIPPVANAGADIVITLPVDNTILSGNAGDADGSVVSYQWSMISGPGQGIINAPTQWATAVLNLAQGVYQFELTVTDDDGATGKDTVQVTVNAAPPPPNLAPVANAGSDIVITLPVDNTTLNGGGSDIDGTIASYQWAIISGPAQGSISNPAQAQTTAVNLVQGVYLVELTVTDDDGATGKDTVQVTVNPAPPVNIPPVANAGSDVIITLPVNNTTLSGSAGDVDGTVVSYQWSMISGPAQATINAPSQWATAVLNLVQGVYQFELTVTDDDGATGKDTVQVTVNPAPPNVPPVANAGQDIIITLPVNNTTLSGSAADVDGTVVSYQWSMISGPAQATINAPTQWATAVLNLVQGVYQFELTVTDDDGATGKDTVQVTVNAAPPLNVAPVANAGNDVTITLPVNAATLNGSGTDADGSVVSFQWTNISGPPSFVIVSASQPQTIVNGLTQGVYLFELAVTDNDGAIGKDTVQVTVNAAPPPVNIPPVAHAGADQTIVFPTTSVQLNGSGTDADGVIVSYLWKKVAGPGIYNIVNPNSAQTSVVGLLQGSAYQFELTVTDDKGATDTDTMTVVVNTAAANVPPVANAGNNEIVYLPTDSIKLNGSGSDADGTVVSYKWTKVSGPAQYTIVSPNAASTVFKDLVEGEYEFELAVTDNWGAKGKDTVKVSVVNYARLNVQTIIFPNPVTTEVNVRIISNTQRSQSFIAIYDARGAMVHKEEFTRTNYIMDRKINVSGLAGGVYLIAIGVDINTTQTFKFVK